MANNSNSVQVQNHSPDPPNPNIKSQSNKSTSNPLHKMTRNRLPTLQEVLARQTRPPLDL